MLSKNKIKFITSLHQKKYREINSCFIAEGPKVVADLLQSKLELLTVCALPIWFSNLDQMPDAECIVITPDELGKMSALSTPSEVLAIFRIPETILLPNEIENSLSIVLDSVRDPGNLGTIIRTADWFGIRAIICSPDSVDVWNPKTVQATMGALANVKVHYAILPDLIKQYASKSFPVYGTFLTGDSIYKASLGTKGFIVMGSESHGISFEIEALVTDKITIPSLNPSQKQSESLNLASATAIVCSEFLRNQK